MEQMKKKSFKLKAEMNGEEKKKSPLIEKIKKIVEKIAREKTEEILSSEIERIVEEKIRRKLKNARIVFGEENKKETNPFREKNRKILEKSTEFTKIHRMNNGVSKLERGTHPINEAGINLVKNIKVNDALKSALLETAMNFSPETLPEDDESEYDKNFKMDERQ